MGHAMGQRYAAAARSGSLPKDSGISWPRSVMHGPEKHRSLFEAFAGLQRDSTEGRLLHCVSTTYAVGSCTELPPNVALCTRAHNLLHMPMSNIAALPEPAMSNWENLR